MSRLLKPCGTRAAYVRHLSYGQAPCDLCTRANRAYETARHPRSRQAPEAQDPLLRELLDLIAGVCRAKGMLP